MTSISIALTTYNGERYLQEQLDSLANQSIAPHELIVGDDGSSDRTVSILQSFAAAATFPVKIHRNERNLGHGENFLRTAARCDGDYIAFCDQDDIWAKNKMERCVDEIARTKAALIIHGGRTFGPATDSPREAIAPVYGDGICMPFTLRAMTFPQGMRMVVDRRVLEQVDASQRPLSFFDEGRNALRMVHDELVFQICRGYTVRIITDDLADYRQHGSNVSGVPPSGDAVEKELSARTGADEYDYLSRYFDRLSKFFERNVHQTTEDTEALRKNTAALHQLYSLRSLVHDKRRSRLKRFRALLEIQKHRRMHDLCRDEYSMKSFAKDALSLSR